MTVAKCAMMQKRMWRSSSVVVGSLKLTFVTAVMIMVAVYIRIQTLLWMETSWGVMRFYNDRPFATTTSRSLPLVSTSECPSLQGVVGDNEHSPLIFHRHNTMVCRTPKAGSTELRLIASSYTVHKNFSLSKNRDFESMLLGKVTDEQLFHHYLYGNEVRRIMFTRHPIRRILSGFLHVASQAKSGFWQLYGSKKKKNLGNGTQAFHMWIRNSTFLQEYDPHCSKASRRFSSHRWKQHWLPAQHCRCGIAECGVSWTYVKLEERPINDMMGELMPGPWIPVPKKHGRIHFRKYKEEDYLTPEILDLLNEATQTEMELFGYRPLVVSNNGTIIEAAAAAK